MFQIKKILLGSTPASIGGIKVYSTGSDNDVVVDADVIFNGDARVVFTLQVRKNQSMH